MIIIFISLYICVAPLNGFVNAKNLVDNSEKWEINILEKDFFYRTPEEVKKDLIIYLNNSLKEYYPRSFRHFGIVVFMSLIFSLIGYYREKKLLTKN